MTPTRPEAGSGGLAADQFEVAALPGALEARLAEGSRFSALLATGEAGGPATLRVVVGSGGRFQVLESRLAPGQSSFPTLTGVAPAAGWYEREIHDRFGLEPEGHPQVEPVVPRAAGEGLFTIPYGPVRSGVFEAIEYVVETYGEDIPALQTRVHYKHRGIAQRFSTLGLDDAVLLSERVEGICSVAHASAFCQAVEELADHQVEVPRRAQLLRVAHGELERVAVHLDSMIRHCEGAGQAVAFARLSTHKERVLRLRAQLCGHRFGRGVVVPGGVSGPPAVPPRAALGTLSGIERALRADLDALMATPSFLDRLRGTGPLDTALAAAHGALGPIGRAAGTGPDLRAERPYGGYRWLGFATAQAHISDALGRQQVRVQEVHQSFHLVRQALDELAEDDQEGAGPDGWRVPVTLGEGVALGAVEAPQGELLYLVEAAGGRLAGVSPRTASFHNLALFPAAFQGDIFTDFVFIEASFGLSFAGVAG